VQADVGDDLSFLVAELEPSFTVNGGKKISPSGGARTSDFDFRFTTIY
jgi:hypothetical protein